MTSTDYLWQFVCQTKEENDELKKTVSVLEIENASLKQEHKNSQELIKTLKQHCGKRARLNDTEVYDQDRYEPPLLIHRTNQTYTDLPTDSEEDEEEPAAKMQKKNIADNKNFVCALQKHFEKVERTEQNHYPFLTLKDMLRILFSSTDTQVQHAMTTKFGVMRPVIEKQLTIACNRGVLPLGPQGSKEKNHQKLDEFVKDLEPIWVEAFGSDYTFKNEWINKVNVDGKQKSVAVPSSKPKHVRFLKVKYTE
jgi:hypothetical protein